MVGESRLEVGLGARNEMGSYVTHYSIERVLDGRHTICGEQSNVDVLSVHDHAYSRDATDNSHCRRPVIRCMHVQGYWIDMSTSGGSMLDVGNKLQYGCPSRRRTE